MRHVFVPSLLLIAALAAPAAAQSRAQVRHVPPAEAEPGQALTLVASVQRGWESNLELRFRPRGAGAWQGAVFTRRDPTTYVATIPGEAIAPPGLEYFILSAGEVETVQFASSVEPHKVNVFHSAVEMRRERHLARHHFRRAKIRLAGEWVDYGSRSFVVDSTTGESIDIPDRYYRVDAEVGYRVLSFPLKTLRFGFTSLLGETPITARGDEGFICQLQQSTSDCSEKVGFKGGGWFELGFVLRDDIELDARGMVMATQTGFNVGGRAELRIGDSEGTHLGVGVETIADVGTGGLVRLAWSTVPGFPMAATVEVTDFPASHRDTAVRLVYDVARPFPGGFRVGVRAGYQARDQLVGGITLGLNTSLEF